MMLMFFHVIGVKEEWKSLDANIETEDQQIERYNLDVLIESEDANKVRSVLENWGIIIVSLKIFSGSEKDFSKIYLRAKNIDENIYLSSPIDDLAEAATLFYNIWLEIIEMNYLLEAIPQQEVVEIMQEAKINVNEEKKRIREIIKTRKLKKDIVFSNQEILKIRSVVDEMVERWDKLTERAVWIIDWKDLKKFKNIRNELSKLRLWTNEIKIIDRWQEYLNMMENIEIEFLEKRKNELWALLDKSSIVSNIDVMKEYAKFFKATRTKAIWWSVARKYSNYITFGTGGIYLKFLALDLAKKFSNLKEVIYKTYDWVEFVIIAIILWVVIYMTLNNLWKDIPVKDFVLLSNIWIVWLIVFLAKFIRKKNIIYLIILIPIIVVLSVILIRNLKINLAL